MGTDTLELLQDLYLQPMVALDLETKDPNLKTDGPGSIRQDGFICGIALASKEIGAYYLPIAHASGNMDKELVLRFMRDFSKKFEGILIGANIIYDLEWLASYGIKFKHCTIYDNQIIEALIDENLSTYKLDALAEKYLGCHKEEDEMIKFAETIGIKENEVKNNMDLYPADIVAGYAKMDASLCIDIFEIQREIIKKDELEKVLDLESRLTPIILEMRLQGTRIDLEAANIFNDELIIKEKESLLNFQKNVGWDCNPRSNEDLTKVFEEVGATIKQTKAGSASFADYVLKEYINSDNEKIALIAKQVSNYRTINKNRSDFIEGTILKKHINGRIHGQFHQIRGDEYGTRTGRMSASNPNLQQQPSRDTFWKSIIRSLYLPNEGCKWDRHDYSQQELRLMVHYAALRQFPGVDEMVYKYRNDASTDFHTVAAAIAGIERRAAKDINFGIAYGMGKKKLCSQLGSTMEEGEKILNTYYNTFPYLKRLVYDTTSIAKTRGYIKTFMGRRARFDKWEPIKNQEDWASMTMYQAYSLEEAKEKYPGRRLERSGAFRALNRVIQGSAADLTKLALVTIYEELGHVPHLQVHDELDFSHTDIEQVKQRAYFMENCYEFQVPMKVDSEVGNNWYNCIPI